jgi:hypothetical protein
VINNYKNPYHRVKFSLKVGIEKARYTSKQWLFGDFSTDIKEITISYNY